MSTFTFNGLKMLYSEKGKTKGKYFLYNLPYILKDIPVISIKVSIPAVLMAYIFVYVYECGISSCSSGYHKRVMKILKYSSCRYCGY